MDRDGGSGDILVLRPLCKLPCQAWARGSMGFLEEEPICFIVAQTTGTGWERWEKPSLLPLCSSPNTNCHLTFHVLLAWLHLLTSQSYKGRLLVILKLFIFNITRKHNTAMQGWSIGGCWLYLLWNILELGRGLFGAQDERFIAGRANKDNKTSIGKGRRHAIAASFHPTTTTPCISLAFRKTLFNIPKLFFHLGDRTALLASTYKIHFLPLPDYHFGRLFSKSSCL